MIRDELRAGVPAGVLAATATAGALIAIGSRTSTAARPFNAIASHLYGSQADAFGFVPGITIVGILVHVILMIAAGVLVAAIARRGLAPAWVASLGVVALSALVSIGLARRGSPSLASLLAIGDLLLYYVVMIVALVVGIRLAFFDRQSDRPQHIDTM